MNGQCQNCKKPLPESPRVFQGVVICNDCFKMVSHFVQRAQSELRMLFLVYTDLLRVALVKGELRPPPAPPPGKEMPRREFAVAFQRMAENFGGLHVDKEKGSSSKDQVQGLRVGGGDADGEVHNR